MQIVNLQRIRPSWQIGTVSHVLHGMGSRQQRCIWTTTPPGLDKLKPEQILIQDNRSFRMRKHGNKPLPLPPLLDEIVTEARMKHEKMKPSYDKNSLTDFQKELALNPYASALVAPFRTCVITGAILPLHFLLAVRSHLVSDEERTAFRTRKRNPNQRKLEVYARLKIDTFTSDVMKRASKGQPSYIVNSALLTDHIAQKTRQWGHLITLSMQDAVVQHFGVSPRSLMNGNFVWDEDADAVVADQIVMAIKQQIKTAEKREHVILLPLADAEEKLSEVDVFVKFGSSVGSLETLHGRHCFEIEAPDESWQSKTFGLLRNQYTVNIHVLLHKLFSYKGHFLPRKPIQHKKIEEDD